MRGQIWIIFIANYIQLEHTHFSQSPASSRRSFKGSIDHMAT